ncbi:MAG: tRNA (adenosine(37)-N6)-threonylcarbamoyltransferase complex ATPase subunit type 1 TsaE [Bacteroidota bacterium]
MAESALHSKKLVCEGLEELHNIVAEIISFAHGYLVWIFDGEMGAGKTTMIRVICEQLEVVDHVHSPTFSIVNEYHTRDSKIINHFDFFRIENEQEALAIGLADYFYSGNFCFIEWPSKIAGFLPNKHLVIHIEVDKYKKRIIDLIKHD